MNPIIIDQRPPPPPRTSVSCHHHLDDNFTGFCPSCLCERLTILDQVVHDDQNGDGIGVSEEQEVRSMDDLENEVVEMEAEIDAIVNNLKSMKDHIDLNSHSKKPSVSNFWSATSVLSKKLQKWRRKEKKSVASSPTLPVEKSISRRGRETLTEIADYGLGRKSCDVDPRFSLDAGTISFDEPRASCDGCLTGRSFPPMAEDVPRPPPRSDMQIPVEERTNAENIPGGSIQTREYYLNSSSNSNRRKSVDRSNSIRKMASAVVAEMDERKTTTTVSNAKVSPDTIDWNHIHGRPKFHSIGGENELERDSYSNSLRDDNGSETLDLGFKDTVNKEAKKSRWWSWKPWRFINSQAANRSGEEPWQDPRRDGNGESNRKLYRSSSSVSWRNSSFNMKKSNSAENGKNRREGDEFVFERNRSARYSPNHINNGLLRLHLTPLHGSRRTTAKSRLSSNSNSTATNRF